LNRGKVFAYIYEINGYEVKGYLLPGTESLIQSHYEGVSQIARIGSFVIINSAGNKIVGVIKSLNVHDLEKLYWTKIKLDEINQQQIRTITVSLIGQFYENEFGKLYFEKGITTYPSLDEEIMIPTQNQLNLILNEASDNCELISIGKAYSNSDISINLDPVKLFSRHTAIVGSTGSGKSCTVTVLLRSLLERSTNNEFPICIFDINGEYSWAFKDQDNIQVIKFADTFPENFPSRIINRLDQVKINYRSFSRRTWRNILKPSEKTQIPAMNFATDSMLYLGYKGSDIIIENISDQDLKNKISEYDNKYFFEPLGGDVSEKNSVKIEEAYKLVGLLSGLTLNNAKIKDDAVEKKLPMDVLAKVICDRWAIQKNKNGYEYNSFNYGYVSSLCDRIIELARDRLFNKCFDTNGYDGYSLNSIEEKLSQCRLLILDFSAVAQEYLPLIVDSILEQFLSTALNGEYKNKPKLLVLDEAHHYLSGNNSSDTNAYLGTSPGERIAKEGRKFGLHLLISTQRPRELSSTIISQIGTIISHALTNEQDRNILNSFGNYNDKGILNEISVLPRREAIIIGHAVSTPVRIKINYLPEKYRPESKDPLEKFF